MCNSSTHRRNAIAAILGKKLKDEMDLDLKVVT